MEQVDGHGGNYDGGDDDFVVDGYILKREPMRKMRKGGQTKTKKNIIYRNDIKYNFGNKGDDCYIK